MRFYIFFQKATTSVLIADLELLNLNNEFLPDKFSVLIAKSEIHAVTYGWVIIEQ